MSRVITELFCRLAADPMVCAELLCREELFAILLQPLERLRAQQLQESTPRVGIRPPAGREQRTSLLSISSSPSASQLLAVSEVLCAIASNSPGRRFFLFGAFGSDPVSKFIDKMYRY